MKKRLDKKNHFFSIFDDKTGLYLRSNVLDNGKDTGIEPFMAEFPELLDVGIMGNCTHGKMGLCESAGIQCYQNGRDINQVNMAVEDFERIAGECKGRTFQFALGGRGDPDQHEDFEEILKICSENKIVPNFTSSGLGFDGRIINLCKRYCGAVAISWYRSRYTTDAIKALTAAGIKTNIHYVLGKNTIDEGIKMLRDNGFPEGINAVVFLLHKPVGLGKAENVLRCNDKKLNEFFRLAQEKRFPFKLGFDSCSVPGILNYMKCVDRDTIDTCEGGRWSAYISSDMKMMPCSFDNQEARWGVDLRHSTIEQAWNSSEFDSFREHFKGACPDCANRKYCMGGCPISPEIVLCENKSV